MMGPSTTQKLVFHSGRFRGFSGHFGTNHAWGEYGFRIFGRYIRFYLQAEGHQFIKSGLCEIESKKVQSKQACL